MTLGRRLVITGAAGNLGAKLRRHLEPTRELVLLDRVQVDGVITADLSRWDEEWARHFHGADAVVHLAGDPIAYHPWPDLIGPNIDAVLNVFEAAVRGGVRRVVFASSNHVMGGYQDQPFQGARKFNGQLMLTHACAIIRQTLISTRLAGST